MEKHILFSSSNTQVFKVKGDNGDFVRKVILCDDPDTVAASLESLIIEHSSICKIYEVRVYTQYFEIDMEYLEGVPITQYLKSAGTVERLRIVRQLVNLVHALYNIRHPYSFVQNNLLVCDGKLKLIGFGIHSHQFANESEIMRMLVAPYFNTGIFSWWFDKITTRNGPKKLTYMAAFSRFLTGYRCYWQSRFVLAFLAIFILVWGVTQRTPDQPNPPIERVIVMDDAETDVFEMYANMIERHNINVIPGNVVQQYLMHHGDADPPDILRHFASQALVYVDVAPEPLRFTSRLVYPDGTEKVIADQFYANEDRSIDHHFVRLLSELKRTKQIETLPVVHDPYTVHTYLVGVHTYNLKGAQAAISYFKVCIDTNPDFHYAYLKYAKCQRNLGNYAQAIKTLETLLQRPGVDDFLRLTSWSILASTYSKIDEYELAVEYYTLALAASRELQNTLVEARMLNNIGGMHYRMQDLSQSRTYYHNAYALKRQFGEWQGIATLYNAAIIAVKEADYTTARDELNHVIDLSERYRDHKHTVSGTLALGWLIYLEDDDVKEAISILNQARAIASQYGFEFLVKEADARIAYINDRLPQ